jgi:hypothetical protein
MEIRRAELTDDFELAHLVVKQWAEEGLPILSGVSRRAMDFVQSSLSSEDFHGFIAWHGETPVGCSGIYAAGVQPWNGQRVCFLPLFYLSKAQRSLGNAMRILRPAVAKAKEMGCTKVIGHVLSDRVLRLDEFMGCKATGYIVEYSLEV